MIFFRFHNLILSINIDLNTLEWMLDFYFNELSFGYVSLKVRLKTNHPQCLLAKIYAISRKNK